MNAKQEPKYKIEDGKIVNRASGEAIPDDEPVMIFRARDCQAADTIEYYGKNLCRDQDHINAVFARWKQFEQWAKDHPERMKEPDTVYPFSG